MKVSTQEPKSVRPTPINPKWIVFTLRGRGFPTPDSDRVKRAISSLNEAEAEELRERVTKLASGTESSSDSTWLVEWANGLKTEGTHAEEAIPAMQNAAKGERPGRTEADLKASRPARDYDKSHHVFSTKGALCIEPVEIITQREGKPDEVYHSLQIEMASALNQSRYDWDRKIIFRLTRRELPLFTAGLFGWCRAIAFGNHGPNKDKYFDMADQAEQGSIFVRLKQGKRVVGVPIGGEEIFEIMAMAMKVLGKNAPFVDSQGLLQMVRRAGAMHSTSVGFKP
jgi:hypothetical protein